jgi:hypothetical protein
MGENRFDSKKDTEIVAAGGFFCHACLVAKPTNEQSPDKRYCQGCYDFLLDEAKMLPSKKRPAWIPKPSTSPATINEKQGLPLYHISPVGDTIMSTLNGEKSEVDIIPSRVARTLGKRGPKHKPLPEDLIKQLAGQDMGSKAIATRLGSEVGIKVSYKTIQRLLSGQRKQKSFVTSMK